MKTILAALAGGLFGGGVAIGVVAAGLIPTSDSAKTGRVAPAEPADAGVVASADDTNDAAISKLQSEIDRMRIAADRAPKPVDENAIHKMVEAELRKQGAGASKPADAPAQPAREGPAKEVSKDEQFVRDVYAKMEAEKVEQRRLDRQAARVAQLEETKKSIVDSVPKFLENQSQRLKLEATQVASLTPALTTYLQQRAEIRSEQQSLRIDGKDSENAAYDEKTKQLEASTLNVLKGIVTEETAQSLLRSSRFLNQGGGQMPTRGAPAPGDGGNNGGNNQRQPRRNGN